MTTDASGPLTNWAGNLTFGAGTVHRPTTVEAVQEVVAGSSRIRALGTRHSFSDVADTHEELVSVAALPRTIEVDSAAGTVRLSAGTRYGELAPVLHAQGFALHNMGSLPHIGVAGAVATATHGSGDRLGNLSSAVVAVELVTADGSLRTLARDVDDDFPGSVVALGALGVVTHLTLQVQPTYDVAQLVVEGLTFDTLEEHFDEVTSAGDSVSLFTDWQGGTVDQVWVKQRVRDGVTHFPEPGWLGTTPDARDAHPLPDGPTVNTTQQGGVPGPWFERLPHFRLEFTPSNGDELQSEYLVDRAVGMAAIRAVESVRDHVTPALLVTELRTVAADDLWLSTAYGRDSVCIHFTWKPDPLAVTAAAAYVEDVLAPFAPRPHWGKLSWIAPDAVAARYPRLGDMVELRQRLDPDGTFRNGYTDRVLGPL
jgi:alditol oxidase